MDYLLILFLFCLTVCLHAHEVDYTNSTYGKLHTIAGKPVALLRLQNGVVVSLATPLPLPCQHMYRHNISEALLSTHASQA